MQSRGSNLAQNSVKIPQNSSLRGFEKRGSNLVQGLINEIASSFVSLTPRNDGILEFQREFQTRIPRNSLYFSAELKKS
ncbi:MAG: hypothetical protein PUJ16_04020 [Campylobacteraceae bacterium]|nr:hypothetical protein [Campylobacteraceae bacterium]